MKAPNRPAVRTSIHCENCTHTKNIKNYTHLQEPGENSHNFPDQMIHVPTGMMPTIIFKCPSGFVCCSALLACWSLKPVLPKAIPISKTLWSGTRDRVQLCMEFEKW